MYARSSIRNYWTARNNHPLYDRQFQIEGRHILVSARITYDLFRFMDKEPASLSYQYAFPKPNPDRLLYWVRHRIWAGTSNCLKVKRLRRCVQTRVLENNVAGSRYQSKNASVGDFSTWRHFPEPNYHLLGEESATLHILVPNA